MNLISVNKELCTKCGICVSRCSDCYTSFDDKIVVDANDDNCNRCGHCVALCPVGAIVHRNMDMENFIQVDKKSKISIHDFTQLIRGRRSHRFFKDKEIRKADLEKLVNICRYSPTGNNSQHVELIIIQDKDKIRKLFNHTIDFFEHNLNALAKESEKCKSIGVEIPLTTKTVLSMRQDLGKLVKSRNNSGTDDIFYEAPVVIIFHAPADYGTPKDDCVIASAIMAMFARTLSLESCYIGYFELAANRYLPIAEELGLNAGNKVFSTLILGYPIYKYFKFVDRRPITAKWI